VRRAASAFHRSPAKKENHRSGGMILAEFLS